MKCSLTLPDGRTVSLVISAPATGDDVVIQVMSDGRTLMRGVYALPLHGGFTTTTHGNNAECPRVQTGEWQRCQGHRHYIPRD